MATDKRKRAIRALAAERGISYTTAMRMHDADRGQSSQATHPVSADYSLSTAGLDLGHLMLVIGGEGSGKTTVAASIAAQALERGIQVEFLSQGASGLKESAGKLTPDEAVARARALRDDLSHRVALDEQAWDDAAHQFELVRRGHAAAPRRRKPSSDSILNDQGLPPILVVDDDMPKAVKARSARKQYLSDLSYIARQGASYGVFLLATRAEALNAFTPYEFMREVGDVLFIGPVAHPALAPPLSSALAQRGLDIDLVLSKAAHQHAGQGIVTYDDYHEEIHVFDPPPPSASVDYGSPHQGGATGPMMRIERS